MIRYIALFFVYVCSLGSSLSGIIHEIKHLRASEEYIDAETFVIFDIDDTLLIPAQTLGTDVWFIERRAEYLSSGLPPEKALDKALSDWEGVRKLTRVVPVEPDAALVVKNIQNRGIRTIGLTTQGLSLARCTVNHLAELGIDLSVTAPCDEEQHFFNGQGVLYRKGILFTAGTHKGSALSAFFERNGLSPRRVLFVNDKLTHLQEIENGLKGTGTEFVGLRYSFSDERVKNYRPEIARIQWKHSTFEHILSDEEAMELHKMQ